MTTAADPLREATVEELRETMEFMRACYNAHTIGLHPFDESHHGLAAAALSLIAEGREKWGPLIERDAEKRENDLWRWGDERDRGLQREYIAWLRSLAGSP